MRRLLLVCADTGEGWNAIAEYSHLLADSLRKERGFAVDVYIHPSAPSLSSREGPGAAQQLVETSRGFDAVVLQYNPFMYGRWGFAPWLAIAFRRLRRSRPRPVLAMMVHEPYVPMTNWRLSLMGLWQRAQLQALRASVDVVFASIEKWTQDFCRMRPSRPTFHLPVASTLPDQIHMRDALRARLGLDQNIVVLTALGTVHPSRPFQRIVSSANAVATQLRARTGLLNLGSDLPELPGLDERVTVHQPGSLPSVQLAQYLSAGDIFLAPFTDGVSTRRTTLMAALQHGLAVVGTNGPLTDTILRTSDALCLAPVDPPTRFSEAVVRLVEASDERVAFSERGRALYSTSFDWPVLTEKLLEGLGQVGQR